MPCKILIMLLNSIIMPHNIIIMLLNIIFMPLHIIIMPLKSIIMQRVLHCQMQNFFIEPPLDTQRKERQGERGMWIAMSCYLPHATHPLPSPPHTTCGHVIRISWRETPPPSPPPYPSTPRCWKLAISGDHRQKRGWPPFRGFKVLQLNLDSFCDHVRIFDAVIGHL